MVRARFRRRDPKERRLSFAVTVTCLLVLSGLSADRVLFHQPVGDPTEYHKRVARLIDAIPLRLGSWLGTDEPLPAAATRLLHPNALLARRFVNSRTGERVSLIIVHCKDARDMGVHYPPVCYPAHGWTQVWAEKRDWDVDGEHIPGMEYEFKRSGLGGDIRMFVSNFVVHPTGEINRTIGGVASASENPRLRTFGAGQFQVVFESRIGAARRKSIVEEFLGYVMESLRAMRTGVAE